MCWRVAPSQPPSSSVNESVLVTGNHFTCPPDQKIITCAVEQMKEWMNKRRDCRIQQVTRASKTLCLAGIQCQRCWTVCCICVLCGVHCGQCGEQRECWDTTVAIHCCEMRSLNTVKMRSQSETTTVNNKGSQRCSHIWENDKWNHQVSCPHALSWKGPRQFRNQGQSMTSTEA